MEEIDFKRNARKEGVILSTIFNSEEKCVRKSTLISNLVNERAAVSASEANGFVDSTLEKKLIVLREYDYDRVYYLTKLGAYEYLFSCDHNLFRKIYSVFNGTGYDPTSVEEFISMKCYRMYLDDEEINLDTLLEEYQAYAKREFNRLHLQN